MTAKIEFFYTHGHTFTASGVIEDTILFDDDYIQYMNVTHKESLDIQTHANHQVAKHDLKFAIVTYGEDSELRGMTVIIHGLVDKFDILATYAEYEKIKKLEDDEREAEERVQYRKLREAEKFVVRRQKRAAERKEQYKK